MDWITDFALKATAIIDPIFAVLIAIVYFRSFMFPTFTKWHKIGLACAVVGLVGQAYWSIHYLFLDQMPDYRTFPLWAFKDLCLYFVGGYFFYLSTMCKLEPKAFTNKIESNGKEEKEKAL